MTESRAPALRSPEDIAHRLALAAARARVERERVARLADDALLAAMRTDDDPFAWAEYFSRFRPLLTDYVGRVRTIPGVDVIDLHHALVDDLLAEEAERLMRSTAGVHTRIAPYLLRAARSRLANLRRSATRRQRLYFGAALDSADGVVDGTMSEYARRSSRARAIHEPSPIAGGAAGAAGAPVAGSASDAERPPPVVASLAALMRAATTPEEQLILSWLGQRIPHRTIATWLGAEYDATAKRCWRLCKRLRAAAVTYAAGLAPDERHEIERFLRRAGVLPALAPPMVAASARPARATRGASAAPVRSIAIDTTVAPATTPSTATIAAPPSGAPSVTELDDHA